MKGKLFLTAIATITTSVTLTALSVRADDSKSELGLPAAASTTDSLGKTSDTSAEWSMNYDTAFKKAEETQRPVLLDFTGSDWCAWCMKHLCLFRLNSHSALNGSKPGEQRYSFPKDFGFSVSFD